MDYKKGFYETITNFKDNEMDLDSFSKEGFNYFHYSAKKQPGTLFFHAALAASELGFAVRHPAVYGNIEGYLEDIDAFYDSMIGENTHE